MIDKISFENPVHPVILSKPLLLSTTYAYVDRNPARSEKNRQSAED
jgi:hypothetical protein